MLSIIQRIIIRLYYEGLILILLVNKKEVEVRQRLRNFTFCKILIDLWPGDWDNQLGKKNVQVDDDNNKNKGKREHK